MSKPEPTDQPVLLDGNASRSLEFGLDDAAAAGVFDDLLRPRDLPVESPGDQLGLYRLLEKIGDGGFGAVWRAEQTEPVRREVALKVIKLGMDTLEVMARFEQERQALARMDHPNIARVLDAGATPEGRAFFVMELVRGCSITEYCTSRRLPLPDRLALVKAVCGGVQHAHQKGIIHRDLKPSNILVTEVDGMPVPKIIDFGIAKATTTDRLTEYTLVTRMGQMIGTPLYMSPEQVAGGAVDVDTRSDVYSLGALMYELLAGRPPFDSRTLLAAGYDEMRRLIREVEPRKPSTVLREAGSEEMRRSCAPSLSFPADLDHITLRALEKDRTRRYESATALGDDIQRFLDHRPVRARPPSMAYLMRRWMRRHRAATAAVSVSLLAIIAGASVAVWQAVRATRAQRAAESQLAEAEEATEVILGAMKGLSRYGSAATITRGELAKELVTSVRGFSGSPVRKARLLVQLADVVSSEDATAIRIEALRLAEPWLDEQDPMLWALRFQRARQSQEPEAIPELRRVLAWYLRSLGKEHGQTFYCAHQLARKLSLAGEHEEALSILTELEAILKQQPDMGSPGSRAFYRLDKAWALHRIGRHEEALGLGRENTRLALAEMGANHHGTGRVFQEQAMLCKENQLLEEAAKTARQAIDIFWRSAGPTNPDCIRCEALLLDILAQQGDTAAKLDFLRDKVQASDNRFGAADPYTAAQVKVYVRALKAAGRLPEADALCEDWLQRVRSSSGAIPLSCEEILRAHIEILRSSSLLPRAEKALRELVALVETSRPRDLQRFGDMSNLADVLIKQNRGTEAMPLLEAVIRTLDERGSENELVKNTHLEQARRRLAEAKGGS